MSEVIHTSNLPRSEREQGREGVASFEDYRQVCETVNNFRKIGIQDKEAYDRVVGDPRTFFVEYGTVQLPLLAPIEFEKMYDEERCRDMTLRPNVLLLSLPLPLLSEAMNPPEIVLGDQTTLIIEEFGDGPHDSNEQRHHLPHFIKGPARSFEFINPDLVSVPGHETSWMAGYSFQFGPDSEPSQPYVQGELGPMLMTAWDEYRVESGLSVTPSEKGSETHVFSAQQLAEMPEVIEGLWAISAVGFGNVLGAHHPVAMEFNREFFDRQIIADNTLTAIHFVDGQPVCFGFIGLDMTNNDWLDCNSDVMRHDIDEAEREKRAYVHFHELISNGFEGMGYSTNILRTFLEIAARTKLDYSIFFESTNLSSTYIPHIVESQIEASGGIAMKTPITMLGKLNYWAIVEDAS
jgi:hypothetical protein